MSDCYYLTPADIERILPSYRRWIDEGKIPYYGSYVPKGQPQQYYYDTYHNSIRENDDGTFRFEIQTFDSAEGDTWVCGIFKIENDAVVIIEQRAEER